MKYLLMGLIRLYQKLFSPLKLTPCCRFYPSCSAYGLQALQKHGAIKGLLLTVWRVLRCNPWNLGGIDYVPKTFYLVPFKGNNHEKDDSGTEMPAPASENGSEGCETHCPSHNRKGD